MKCYRDFWRKGLSTTWDVVASGKNCLEYTRDTSCRILVTLPVVVQPSFLALSQSYFIDQVLDLSRIFWVSEWMFFLYILLSFGYSLCIYPLLHSNFMLFFLYDPCVFWEVGINRHTYIGGYVFPFNLVCELACRIQSLEICIYLHTRL